MPNMRSMNKPFLSILVPCYNVAEFLPRTIQSLRELQDAEDVEFIMINDGSKDNSLTLLQEFAAMDSRAILINQENQGVARARNNGIQHVNGEYLLLLDGDDYLDRDAVQCIRRNMNGEDALLPNTRFITEPGTPIQHIIIPNGVYTIEELFSHFKVFPVSPKLIYKTSIFKDYNILFNPDMKAGEVFDFTIQHLSHCKNIVTINDAFYNYIFHPKSATHRPNTDADKTVMMLLDRIDTIHSPWQNSYCLQSTIFKLITSFTYNKYLRNGLMTDDYISTVRDICSDQRFKQLLRYLIHHSLSQPKIFILAMYMLIVPSVFGYKLATKTYQMLHNIHRHV